MIRNMQFFIYFKAQFMTLAAILIVGVLITLYLNINRVIFLTPTHYLPEYALLIKNIREKFLEVVNISRNCEEFKYNVEEFSEILKKLIKFGYYVNITVRISPCQPPFPFSEFPTTSEVEIMFSDGRTLYKEVLIFSWKPN